MCKVTYLVPNILANQMSIKMASVPDLVSMPTRWALSMQTYFKVQWSRSNLRESCSTAYLEETKELQKASWWNISYFDEPEHITTFSRAYVLSLGNHSLTVGDLWETERNVCSQEASFSQAYLWYDSDSKEKIELYWTVHQLPKVETPLKIHKEPLKGCMHIRRKSITVT